MAAAIVRARKSAARPSSGIGFQKEQVKDKMNRIVAASTIAYLIVILNGRTNANELAQSGAVLFKTHCSRCHGSEAAGQDPAQPSGGWDDNMNRLAPALNGTGHAWHHSPELTYEYIEKGSIDKTSPMPAFGDILKHNDIKAIIAYINSLWPDKIMDSYRMRFKKEEP